MRDDWIKVWLESQEELDEMTKYIGWDLGHKERVEIYFIRRIDGKLRITNK